MEQGMAQRSPLIRERMKTPRAAAIAGILFSILLTTILVLLRISVQAASQEARVRLAGDADTVVLALNLVPFAGIAFLWFIGVVRDPLGATRTASLPPFSWAAGFYFSPCSLPRPRWQGRHSLRSRRRRTR